MAVIRISLWQRLLERMNWLGHDPASGRLGDFTTTKRIIPISLIAVGVGVVSAYVALMLLRLIGFSLTFSFSSAGTRPWFRRLGTIWASG